MHLLHVSQIVNPWPHGRIKPSSFSLFVVTIVFMSRVSYVVTLFLIVVRRYFLILESVAMTDAAAHCMFMMTIVTFDLVAPTGVAITLFWVSD